MAPIARKAALVGAGVIVSVALARGALFLASAANAPIRFDVGPNTGPYLEGFTESEERVPVSFRWTREQARISLPLESRVSEATIRIRFARFLPGNAQVRLFVGGAAAGTFSARSGRFRTLELPLRLGAGPIDVALAVDDPAAEKLGIAMDWIEIEAARRLSPRGLAPAILVGGIFALAFLLGYSLPLSLAWSVGAAVLQAAWFAIDPFAMTHAVSELTLLALASTAIVAVAFRKARLVPMLFLLGLLLKGAVLFHPSHWYPDVRLHRRYVEAFRAADGGLLERGIEAQVASGTAYARELAGRGYAFPYSPLFYVPFAALDQDARELERTMKRTGLLLAAVELPLVYLLAKSVLGAGAALWAAGLVWLLPPIASRMLYAQWPTLAGHLLDLLLLAAAAALARRPDAVGTALRYAGAGLLTCLVYISSLFHFSVLTAALVALHPRRALLWLGLGAAVGVTVIALLYLPFVGLLVSEVLPAVRAGTPLLGAGSARPDFLDVLARVPAFFGYGLPALAVAGLALVRDRGPAFRFLAAYGLAFVVLLALRASSGAFKDLKELVFVGPFVAMTAGASLESLAARGRAGRVAAWLVLVGLAGFGLSTLAGYAWQHTSLVGLH